MVFSNVKFLLVHNQHSKIDLGGKLKSNENKNGNVVRAFTKIGPVLWKANMRQIWPTVTTLQKLHMDIEYWFPHWESRSYVHNMRDFDNLQLQVWKYVRWVSTIRYWRIKTRWQRVGHNSPLRNIQDFNLHK